MEQHRFAGFLISKQVLDEPIVYEALNEQRARKIPIGKLAITEGFLTVRQVMKVLREQAGTDRRFGELAVELEFLSEVGLAELLALQLERCPLIGEILVEQAHLTHAERDALVAEFQRTTGA